MWRARVVRPSWVGPLTRIFFGAGAAGLCLYELHGLWLDENAYVTSLKFADWPQENRIQDIWWYLNGHPGLLLCHGWSTEADIRHKSGFFFNQEAALPDASVSPDAGENPDSTACSKDDQRAVLTRYTIADAAAKAASAVVHITVTIGEKGLLFGQGAGSGVIINSDGTILTNAHVVAGYGNGMYTGKVKVSMQDGRTFDGKVVSYDSASDIAVVSIESKSPLPAVTLGSSRRIRPGEWVIALGSPLHLQNSVTVGVVSCVERKSSEIGLRGIHGGYIQTDAAINQGNSGGPLLNLDGEVIGINTMKAFAADGVSFAIPIDTAVKVMEQLKKHGRVVRPWLGLKMLELNQHVLSQLKEQDPAFPDVSEGVLVPQVIPGSPAERAGVRAGDVIVQFDGMPVSKASQIVDRLGDKVGVPFKVLVKRAQNQPITLVVTTEEARANL